MRKRLDYTFYIKTLVQIRKQLQVGQLSESQILFSLLK